VISQHFRVERLSDSHDRSAFSCGNSALDQYFREQAGQDLRRHLSTVFVLFDSAHGVVAGYYTLSAFLIMPQALPVAIAKRLPRRPVPATLIGRFALDLRYRGRGLGGALFANALTRAVDASADIGSMAVVVDAKDDQARGFYEHYSFQRFPDDEYRLFLHMDDAERVARIVKTE
jgi:GNAT superfamily N-acetyltransferase